MAHCYPCFSIYIAELHACAIYIIWRTCLYDLRARADDSTV